MHEVQGSAHLLLDIAFIVHKYTSRSEFLFFINNLAIKKDFQNHEKSKNSVLDKSSIFYIEISKRMCLKYHIKFKNNCRQ